MKLFVTACVCCFVNVIMHIKGFLILYLLYEILVYFYTNDTYFWILFVICYQLCLLVYDFRKHNILTVG